MLEIFLGSIAFSLALIAFTAGAWLTVSAKKYPHGGKIAGLVITTLATLSLIFISYNAAKTTFLQSSLQKTMYARMNENMKHMPNNPQYQKKHSNRSQNNN